MDDVFRLDCDRIGWTEIYREDRSSVNILGQIFHLNYEQILLNQWTRGQRVSMTRLYVKVLSCKLHKCFTSKVIKYLWCFCIPGAELGGVDDVPVFDPSTLDPNRCESCYGAETDDLK